MDKSVCILGCGCTPVGEHWDKSIYDLSVEAFWAAMRDAHCERVDALVVGNMLSGRLNMQENLGAAIADRVGLAGIEAFKVEAACASGAAALRAGAIMIASGYFQRVAVLGVEKMTDSLPAEVSQALATAAAFEEETVVGASFSSLAALLTSLYVQTYPAAGDALLKFVLHAHRQSAETPWAMFRRPLSIREWSDSPIVASPLRLLDCAPICDGAAAVILGNRKMAEDSTVPVIEILACEGATASLAVTRRCEPLRLMAAENSASRALAAAGVTPEQIDVFEPHDAFPVMAALSLEAAGLLPLGDGWRFFEDDATGHRRELAIQTMGGLKARGHPVGATGVYQVLEACQQLRGQAQGNRFPQPMTAMTMNLAGVASNAYTTILQRKSD